MKRLPEIFIFLLSIAYADSLDTDVSHVIIDHKGNSIIALVDSMDLDIVYYTYKIDNKSSIIVGAPRKADKDIRNSVFVLDNGKILTYRD